MNKTAVYEETVNRNVLKERSGIGVIIGRFQSPYPHKGHRDLLSYVFSKHLKVIIIVGQTGHGMSTLKNPLSFWDVKDSLEKYLDKEAQFSYNNFHDNFLIVPVKDKDSDEEWSRDIDNKIRELIPVSYNDKITLYGSRDSFSKYYSGNYTVENFEPETIISASEIRNRICTNNYTSEDIRTGKILANYHQYQTPIPTVDGLVYKEDSSGNISILLVSKTHGKSWRLPGGFCESNTYENNIKREIKEELPGLEVDTPIYVNSLIVDDWRYRSENRKILTSLFLLKYLFGNPKPSDDINDSRWFTLNCRFEFDQFDIKIDQEHKELIKLGLSSLETKISQERDNKNA